MKYDAIIVASGEGKRAELGFNKVLFIMENGKTVLENSCKQFFDDKDCVRVVVVTNDSLNFTNPKMIIVPGGKERYNSVINGLNEVKEEYVFIHDGVRPFFQKKDLDKLKEALKDNDAAILAVKATNTIKYVEDGMIVKTIDREKVYGAQTPQAFKADLIKKANEQLVATNVTDDASVFEVLDIDIKVVEGDSTNIKLTNKEDFIGI